MQTDMEGLCYLLCPEDKDFLFLFLVSVLVEKKVFTQNCFKTSWFKRWQRLGKTYNLKVIADCCWVGLERQCFRQVFMYNQLTVLLLLAIVWKKIFVILSVIRQITHVSPFFNIFSGFVLSEFDTSDSILNLASFIIKTPQRLHYTEQQEEEMEKKKMAKNEEKKIRCFGAKGRRET